MFYSRGALRALVLGALFGGASGPASLAQEVSGVRLSQLRPVERYRVPDCRDSLTICLALDLDAFGYDLEIDGVPAARKTPCAAETLTSYNLDSLLGGANTESAYELTWRLAPGARRGRITTVSELVSFLRENDPAGAWHLAGDNRLLVGEPSSRLGELLAFGVDSRAIRRAEPAPYVSAFGQGIRLGSGLHNLVLIGQLGERDSTLVVVDCGSFPVDSIKVMKGLAATHCVSLPGRVEDYELTFGCAPIDPAVESVDFYSVTDGCIRFAAEEVGEAYTCVEYCERSTGFRGKVGLYVEVLAAASIGNPVANDDQYGIAYNGQRMLPVLANDEVTEAATRILLRSGVTKGEVRVDPRNRLHYTAPIDFCGLDRISYEVCNTGGCDTASVRLEVTCDALLVFNGLSPNHDGRNDAFTVLGIENYPNNTLLVFDQHGHRVYATEGYANDWRGTGAGAPLPNGTYYYVIQVPGREPLSGPLQIIR